MTAAAVNGGSGDDVFVINDNDRMVADRLLLPPPLMLPPPHPCPCLCCHHCCSLRQRHCPSNAPADGWLLCRLSLLVCCVVRCPNLSAPAVVRCVVDAFLPGRRPLSLTIASCCLLLFTKHQLPLPFPLQVGCCVLRPSSSIMTTSPS